MKKTMKILSCLTVVVAAVVAVLGVLGIVDIETALGAGAMMAVAPVATFEGAKEGDTHTGSQPFMTTEPVGGKVSSVAPEDKPAHNTTTVSQKLSKIQPSLTPIDTFLRNIGSGKTNSDVFEFYSIVSRGVKAVVGSNVTAGETAEITLSSGAHCLSLDGDLLVPSYEVVNGEAQAISSNASFAMRPLVLHIVGIDYAAKKITVIGVNADVPALPVDTELFRMASAKDQDAAISNDPMATPTKDANFCQRNIATVSENAYQALQDKEVEYGIAEFKEQALLDFRYQAEISSIFGAQYAKNNGELIDPTTQKRKLHMRGLLDFNIPHITRSENETIEEFLNKAMQTSFSNNNGSEKRLFLYGPDVATEMANSGAFQKQLEAGKTEVKWGITWKVIETNFGTLMGIMHNALGLVGFGKAALIIDPANIRRIEQAPLTMENLDLKKDGIRNSKDVLLEEAWTLEVTNPTTHALLDFGA